MSKKQHQHYVPQVYLKRFAFDSEKRLYYLKKRPKSKKDKVKWTHTAKVCYEPDRFRIRNLQNFKYLDVKDENFIENNLFKYEDTELTDILDTIERRANLSRRKAKRLLEIIFSIKRRNPIFGNLFTPENAAKTGQSAIQDLKVLIEQTSEILDSNHPVVKECVKFFEEDIKNPEFARDLYNGVLIEIEAKRHEGEEERINTLLDKKFEILQTTHRTPFITSDNPGYTLDKDRQVLNLEMAYVDLLVFPLSPLSLLKISLREQDVSNKFLICKDLNYRFTHPNEVLAYNRGTFLNSTTRVFSSEENSLSILREYYY